MEAPKCQCQICHCHEYCKYQAVKVIKRISGVLHKCFVPSSISIRYSEDLSSDAGSEIFGIVTTNFSPSSIGTRSSNDLSSDVAFQHQVVKVIKRISGVLRNFLVYSSISTKSSKDLSSDVASNISCISTGSFVPSSIGTGSLKDLSSDVASNISNIISTSSLAPSSISTSSLKDPCCTTTCAELPIDVILNILSRQPSETLFTCRGVCKSWRDIIDSFAGDPTPTAQVTRLLLLCCSREYPATGRGNLRIVLLKSDGTNQTVTFSESPIAVFANSNRYWLDSICYGLVCFKDFQGQKQPFLFDPLREELLVLPRLNISTRSRTHLECYGLGFDSSTETYKLVHVYAKRSNSVGYWGTSESTFVDFALVTEVLELGTVSWREISAVPPYPLHGSAISAYGDIHWKAPINNLNSTGAIISFDSKEEIFRLTPSPAFFVGVYDCNHLFDFKGSLAVADVSSTKLIEIWVMKDYDKKNWVKEYRISMDVWARDLNPNIWLPVWWLNFSFVGTWKDGFVFDIGRDGLFYYDPQTDSQWRLSVPAPQSDFPRRKIFSCTGSILSLKNYGNLVPREKRQQNYFDLCTASFL